MRALITTDLHLTENPLDAYRWGIFDVIDRAIEKHGISKVIIMGDITDKKDNHSALLVNMVVHQLEALATRVSVVVVKGNHDYYNDPAMPFFSFLDGTNGIMFVTNNDAEGVDGKVLQYIGHTHDADKFKTAVGARDFDYLFIHQTVNKAITSNGYEIAGISSDFGGAKVFSGDIHVPQKVGDVVYVGSPYPVHQGDEFQPRYAILDIGTGKTVFKKINTIRKPVINIESIKRVRGTLRKAGLKKGDQVKVCVHLAASESSSWAGVRQKIADELSGKGVVLCGVELVAKQGVTKKVKSKRFGVSTDKRKVLQRYCKNNKVDADKAEKGKGVLDAVK